MGLRGAHWYLQVRQGFLLRRAFSLNAQASTVLVGDPNSPAPAASPTAKVLWPL